MTALLHALLALLLVVLAPQFASCQDDLTVCQGMVPDVAFTGTVTHEAVAFDPSATLTTIFADLARHRHPDLARRVKEIAATFDDDTKLGCIGDLIEHLASTPHYSFDLMYRDASQENPPLIRLASEIRLKELLEANYSFPNPERWTTTCLGDRHGVECDVADGFYCAVPTTLSYLKFESAWPRIAIANINMCQVITLAFTRGDNRPQSASAAIRAFKKAERDLDCYGEWIGLTNNYQDDCTATIDPASKPASQIWELQYSVKGLPRKVHLVVRDHFDVDGTFITDYYSHDSLWRVFTGRDTYIPFYTSDNRFAALAVVTTLASDKSTDLLRNTIRQNLGNLKHWAQQRHR